MSHIIYIKIVYAVLKPVPIKYKTKITDKRFVNFKIVCIIIIFLIVKIKQQFRERLIK